MTDLRLKSPTGRALCENEQSRFCKQASFTKTGQAPTGNGIFHTRKSTVSAREVQMLIFVRERNERRGGDHGADHRVKLVGIGY